MGSSFPTLRVDLSLPAHARWAGLAAHRAMARDMVAQYVGELAGIARDEELLLATVGANEAVALTPSLRAEIDSVARAIDVPRARVLAANLYYDAFRVLMGCTAFAIDRDDGPLHARNLDWWTENGLLSRATVLTEFVAGPVGPFTTIGWPGLVGAFSGVAMGRFAVTMNAVLSEERPTIATSTPALLRDVLETTPTYAEARERLARTPIASDCLLLLTYPFTGPAQWRRAAGMAHKRLTSSVRPLRRTKVRLGSSFRARSFLGSFERRVLSEA